MTATIADPLPAVTTATPPTPTTTTLPDITTTHPNPPVNPYANVYNNPVAYNVANLHFFTAVTLAVGITCACAYMAWVRQRGEKLALAVLVFHLLPVCGFAVTSVYYGLVAYDGYYPFGSTAFTGFETSMTIFSPLRYLPYLVLELRLVAMCYGYPSLPRMVWINAYSVKGSYMGLRWMVAVLIGLFVPFFLLLIISYANASLVYAMNVIDAVITFVLLASGIVGCSLLLRPHIRQSLRRFDLDQLSILITFFGTFTVFSIYVRANYVLYLSQGDSPNPGYVDALVWLNAIADTIHVCLGFLTFSLWVIILRVMRKTPPGANLVTRIRRAVSRSSISEDEEKKKKIEKTVISSISTQDTTTFTSSRQGSITSDVVPRHTSQASTICMESQTSTPQILIVQYPTYTEADLCTMVSV
eukprot:comp21228_c0_seq1/m.28889 comp21228_c0_seq1/g.28889  ORF comp21228_c0_seq1/g.28889 comp21228_c0_seq1/m.28889 type:complete len:415 (-) comp21228_c0_seq1:141-1385(-)